jgi:hypothetical protein
MCNSKEILLNFLAILRTGRELVIAPQLLDTPLSVADLRKVILNLDTPGHWIEVVLRLLIRGVVYPSYAKGIVSVA